MPEAPVKRCRRKPYFSANNYRAIQYTGDNQDALGRFAPGLTYRMLARPLGEPAANTQDLLLIDYDRSLQRIKVGDYLTHAEPQPDSQSEHKRAGWHHIMSAEDYEHRWTPPENPAAAHSCQPTDPPPPADGQPYVALQYTGDNFEQLNQLTAGHIVQLPVQDLSKDEATAIVVSTAYRDLERIREQDYAVIPVNAETRQINPERIEILPPEEFDEFFEEME